MGLEPTLKAWKAFVLPLHNTRKIKYKPLRKNKIDRQVKKNDDSIFVAGASIYHGLKFSYVLRAFRKEFK